MEVMLILFSGIIAVCCGQERVKMTLMDIRYRESEDTTSTNRYQCYLSDPDESGTVESLRIGDTRARDRTPDLNPAPPSPVYSGDPTYPHWEVTFNQTTAQPDSAFGVFGCNASIDGKPTTLVPTVRMRSNADVVPVNGLLTQTANVGDEGVNITMQTTRTNRGLTWRKDVTIQKKFNDKPVYTIDVPVSVDDAGIYECHIDWERTGARHALHLLIVRACPAYKWDPPSCDQACDECYNGGVCDENSGKCICPAGFMGTNCESACGDSNTFGDDCTLHCSSNLTNVDACSTNLFCRPHPAGCRCITGFEGLDCDQECTEGTFGASCLQTCHCADGVSCDRSTGSCSGNCLSGWQGDTCQDCVGDKYGEDCSEDCHCNGDSCSQMLGWCSGNCFSQWVDMFPPNNCRTGLTDASFHKGNQGVSVPVNCTALQGPGDDLRSLDMVLSRHETDLDNDSISPGIIVADDGETKTVLFLVDDVAPSGETMYCQLRSDDQGRAVLAIHVSFFELPMLTSAPRLRSTSKSTVEIEWDAWDGGTGDGPVIGYVPYYKTVTDNTWLAGELTQNQDFTFTGLSPDTRYSFSVAAVREGEYGQGLRSPSTVATTLCTHPLEGPKHVLAEVSGDHQELVKLTWQLPGYGEIPCSTGAIAVTTYVRVNSTSSGGWWAVHVPVDSSSHTFNNLTIEETYTFKMSLTTTGGESQLTDGVDHTVPRLPVYQTKPAVSERSSTSLTVEWDLWDEEIGTPPVVQYVIYYRLNTSLTEWMSISVGASQQSETLGGLDADTGYDISIAAVREGPNGEGSRGPVLGGEATLCGDPGSSAVPTDVKADYTNEHQDQVNVTWKFQQENVECSTGVDHFTIYYSSQSRDESQEIVDNPDARWHVISDLEPGVLYTFMVTVSTSGGESEARKSSEAELSPETPSAIVISLSVALALAALIILLLAVLYYKRRQRDKETTSPPTAAAMSKIENSAYEDPDVLHITNKYQSTVDSEYQNDIVRHTPRTIPVARATTAEMENSAYDTIDVLPEKTGSTRVNAMTELPPIPVAQHEGYVKKC